MALTRRRFVEALGAASASVWGGTAAASQGGPPAYARAGAACVMVEDQVSPKKCGHTRGKQVIPREEARRVAVWNAFLISRKVTKPDQLTGELMRNFAQARRAGAIFVQDERSETPKNSLRPRSHAVHLALRRLRHG